MTAGDSRASLLLALLLQLAAIVALLLINGLSPPGVFLLLAWSVLGVLGLLVNIYFFALLAMIILSWVAAGSRHPAIYLLYPQAPGSTARTGTQVMLKFVSGYLTEYSLSVDNLFVFLAIFGYYWSR